MYTVEVTRDWNWFVLHIFITTVYEAKYWWEKHFYQYNKCYSYIPAPSSPHPRNIWANSPIYANLFCGFIFYILYENLTKISIQSLLRGRFLRNGRPVEDERPPSLAARELGQIRQRHPVSGLRYCFLCHSITRKCFFFILKYY